MTKLCPRGKAAAKRKFSVYPSAYANAYASKICAGKIKDPSGKKRKDFRGPKPAKAMGGRIYKANGGEINRINKIRSDQMKRKGPTIVPGAKERSLLKERKPKKPLKGQMKKPKPGTYDYQLQETMRPDYRRPKKAGGGLMEATQRLRRQGLKRGGGVCLRGMNREAVGKNS